MSRYKTARLLTIALAAAIRRLETGEIGHATGRLADKQPQFINSVLFKVITLTHSRNKYVCTQFDVFELFRFPTTSRRNTTEELAALLH